MTSKKPSGRQDTEGHFNFEKILLVSELLRQKNCEALLDDGSKAEKVNCRHGKEGNLNVYIDH